MLKKISSVIVAVILVSSLSLTAFAAGTVTKIDDGVFVANLSYESGDIFTPGKTISAIDSAFEPGETLNIYLDPSKISGDGVKFDPETGMSAQDLADAGVSAKISGGNNPNLVESATFKEQELNGKQVALIQINFSKDSSSDGKEFTTKILLLADGTRQELPISGTVGGTSSTVTISADKEYVYLGNGETAKPEGDIEKIKVDLGNNVVLHTQMEKDKSYSGSANVKISEKDEVILEKLSENSSVVNLSIKGFDSAKTKVQISSDSVMYVYDSSGKKLGTTDDKFSYAEKFYLSDKDVDVNLGTLEVKEDGEPEAEPDDLPVPIAGDDNAIPNTGISSVTKIAGAVLIIGVVTILILFATGFKRKN